MSFLDRLSFQLYSARKFPPLETQLATLAGLGYVNVEPYGGLLADAGGLKAGLERHGLKAPSSHVGLDSLRSSLDTVAAQARDLGIKLVIVPAIPPNARPTDAEGWRRLGRELGADRRQARRAGPRRSPGTTTISSSASSPTAAIRSTCMFEAAPKLLWEADIGWLHAAGEDPLRWIEKYRDRVRAVHVKDKAPEGEKANEDGWTDIGDGVIDWKRLKPALSAKGLDLLVLEHDNPADYESFARRSRAAIAAW